MKTLIITDNSHALDLAGVLQQRHGGIDVCQSPSGSLPDIRRVNVRGQIEEIVSQYDLLISIHCKQLFPAELVGKIRCVNVHPGFNPYNRGWFPQVFSLINGLKTGITIHEIDEQLDHGPIIVQREYALESWDTSGSAYAKIMQIERELVLEYFELIRDRQYTATAPLGEGNINYKKDFERIKALDLKEQATLGDFINRLRALTHDSFKNAYYLDKNGRKIFVRIMLDPE